MTGWTPIRRRSRWLTAFCLVVGLVAVGCELIPDQDVWVEPLLDERWPADVLVEARGFEIVKAAAGQRLLAGWELTKADDGAVVARPLPGQLGRFEIIHLTARSRTLQLTFVDGPAEASPEDLLNRTAAVYAGDRKVADVELGPPGSLSRTAPVDFELPDDLPAGRVVLDLDLPEGVGLVVRRSGLRSTSVPGSVAIEGGRIEQSGDSFVDIVRPLRPRARLRGRLEWPDPVSPGQSFEIVVESAGGGEERHPVKAGFLGRLRGEVEIDIDLRLGRDVAAAGPEPHRVRLIARGEGPPATWLDLKVEQSGLVDAPPTAEVPDAPPVVVLYVLDALRASAVGHLGGDPRATPNIDRLALDGVTFLDHQSVAPNTTASTKSLFTGRYYPLLGEKKLPEDGPATLAELFRGAGYRTGAFSGNGNLSAPLGNIRGFEVLARAPTSEPRRSTRGYNDDAERVQGAALEWLDSLGTDDKVFLYLHTVHPHSPYDPPEPFRSQFVTERGSSVAGDRLTLRRLTEEGPEGASPADRRRLHQLYDGGLAYNDHHLGPFLTELRRRYADRDLLLIVTSDHGEELYEHGGILHGFTLYREMLHVPMIFHWPGTLEPRRIDGLTDGVDLHETLRALIGEAPADGLGEARSLWPHLLRGDGAPRIRFGTKSGRGVTYHMAEDGRFKLIWAPGDGELPGMGRGGARESVLEHVYDLQNDPGEQRNLAGDPRLEVEWLRARLRGFITRGSRLEVGEEVDEFDEETLGILRALGYVD
ncbi:MAG: sulfatase [Acidobacteriota bacterium]